MHIAVAGNIGSGKTTLTSLLSKHFGWKPHYEEVDNNPYLSSFYEDAYIFASNLYDMGLMSARDYENYRSLFELMGSYMQAPDLLIYLRASIPTLVRQIAKRNRLYEQSIRLDYLKSLNDKYESWISSYDKGKVLIIESDNIEIENPDDLSKIIDSINASLNGLFTF